MSNRIAYIMQAHKNVEQINLLIDKLIDENVDVYLHVDKKAVNIREKITQRDNLYILSLEDSVNVQWGDITQVQATLALLKEVFKVNKIYKFVYLISGQCFPIKTKEQRTLFFENADKHDCFVECYQSKVFDKRSDIKYNSFLLKNKFLSRVFKKLYIYLTGGKSHTFKIFKRTRPVEQFYHGSSWWCLPYGFAKIIFDKVSEENVWLEFFSKSVCPDESFFQTLLVKFCTNANICKLTTYVDWNEGQRNPKILTMDDEEKLIESECLFARKFDMNIDSDIVKRFC